MQRTKKQFACLAACAKNCATCWKMRAKHCSVELDQTQQGRLSRMDAMQQQAMADETQRRRHVRLAQIDAALARLDERIRLLRDCGEEINADGWRSTPPLPGVCAMPDDVLGTFRRRALHIIDVAANKAKR